MPHEQPWTDDYHKNHLADLHEKWNKEKKVMETQNRALRTVLNECPFDLRTPETCRDCGNEACVQAYKEQNEIWGKDSEEPAFPVNTAKDHQAAGMSPAASRFRNTPEFHSPTRPVSGSDRDLFWLINQESEEKAE